MSARIIPVDIFDLVIFGATGDLSRRKLLPALYYRSKDGQLPEEARIIGTSRRAMTNEEFRDFARKSIADHVEAAEQTPEAIAGFCDRLSYVAIDAAQETGWDELAGLLKGHEDRIRVFYLSVGPDLFGTIVEKLGAYDLVTPKARVVLEKPLGHDLASSQALNDTIGGVFPEDRTYRIDHYLGKETVQNLLALRFANALFEPLWNAAHIDHVQITVAETLGVGDRGGYYDTAGALRDMVQNHMMQLLCLVAMEAPVSIAADAVRDEKLKVLKSLNPINETNVAQCSVRGQYRAGVENDEHVKGYLDEVGVPKSTTETFVALRVDIENWRWAGVPFFLRTGKRLPKRVSEIIVEFRPVPHNVFGAAVGMPAPNRLVIRLQPDEGVKLWLMIKDAGPGGMRLKAVPLDMSFADTFSSRSPDAYERLITDVIRGNQTLFMRRDEVEAAWSWIDPIREAWDQLGEAPKSYTSGTWGPSTAVAMIERDGRTWYEDLAP